MFSSEGHKILNWISYLNKMTNKQKHTKGTNTQNYKTKQQQQKETQEQM